MSEKLDRPEVADEVVDAAPATSAIAEYNATESALADLRKRLEGKTYDLRTTAGDKQARADRLELTRLISALEDRRVEVKAPVLARERLIDAEAKRITASLESLRKPIDAQIKADEARREEERLARAAAEAARVAALRKRIEYLRGIAPRAAGQPAAEIAAKIAMVEGIAIGEDFAEFKVEAQDVHAQLLTQLRDMHTATVAQEAEAARVKAESERLARVDHFGRKLMELRSLSVGMGSRSAEAIRLGITTLERVSVSEDDWAEFTSQAIEAREAVLDELQAMLTAAEDRERVAAEQAAEAQRLAVQKAEQERIAAEQRAAEVQRQQEADARAESERLEKLADERRAALAASVAQSAEPVVLTYGPEVQKFAADALQAMAPVLIGIDPGAPEGDRAVTCYVMPDPSRAFADDIAALAAEARASRFPSQPKMEPAWWARFYALADRMGDVA